MNRALGVRLACAMLSLLFACTSRAVELGEAVPSLKIDQWVKGPAVDLRDGRNKTIFVVVFWESGCDACRNSLPHLTELQKRFKVQGVVVIGISEEPADTLKAFV